MTTIQQALQIGWQLQQSHDFAAAESIYQRVLTVNPGHADAWCYLGILYYDMSRYQDSRAAYEQALRLRPRFPIALSNMGNTLSALGKYLEGEASIRQALEYEPSYANGWTNLGAVLVKQGRLLEAIDCFQRALGLSPDSEPAHRNLGAALVRRGDLQEGQRHSEAALNINPRSAEAHRNRAIVRLLTGDWEQGWSEFEWRWQCAEQKLPNYPQPSWNGELLEGRRLLMFAEQGLGDTIQFVRYAALARERGARVLVECQASLVPLLSSFPDVELVPRGTAPPAFDTHIALMSAPRVFATRADNVPADVPYLFARPELENTWRERLVNYKERRIGIVWQGSRDHPADRDRSAPLAALAPVAGLNVQLISLQKGFGAEQLPLCGFRDAIVDFGESLDAGGMFLDTAAIMKNLDLVITVDTALAHLAGALGVKVWLALSKVPDWRWLQERSDTPWYPTMRLFRQTTAGDWNSVFAAMAKELK